MTGDELIQVYARCAALGFAHENARRDVLIYKDDHGKDVAKIFGIEPPASLGRPGEQHILVVWEYSEGSPVPRTTVDFDAAMHHIASIIQKNNS
jgi:hypothetical protein